VSVPGTNKDERVVAVNPLRVKQMQESFPDAFVCPGCGSVEPYPCKQTANCPTDKLPVIELGGLMEKVKYEPPGVIITEPIRAWVVADCGISLGSCNAFASFGLAKGESLDGVRALKQPPVTIAAETEEDLRLKLHALVEALFEDGE